MKKMIYFVIAYTVAALVTGVFFREFTKAYGFTDVTALGKMHVHLFALGMLFFLIVGLLSDFYHMNDSRLFRPFLIVYNIGLPFAVVMMLVRGVVEVAVPGSLSSAESDAISYLAGLGHIILAIGIILFLICLAKSVTSKVKKAKIALHVES